MTRKNTFKTAFGPYYPILIFFLLILSFLSLSRLGLVLLYHHRIQDISWVLKIMVYGLRIDTVLAVYSVSLPVLLAPFFEGYSKTHRVWHNSLSVWFTAWAVFIVVMEISTPGFIKEYDVRPNRLFVEYLIYPKEVISMLLKGYLVSVTAGLLALFATAYYGYNYFRKLTAPPSEWKPYLKFAVLPLIAVLLFIGGRSSLGHRAVSPSNVAFSNDSMVNDLPLNSAYSLLYAIHRMQDEADASKVYGKMDLNRMLELSRSTTSEDPSVFNDPNNPIMHRMEAGAHPAPPLNLVIILEESLGAEFVQRLGGLPLTPHLEALAREGWWFDNLYATGTRSVRGIEAVVCGFPPTPGRSVVKLGRSQRNFFSLAALLSKRGYTTQFIYGGDSNFDNMKGFFLANGFQDVFDEKNFENPSFKGSWGVSDQDLFNKADEYLTRQNGKPTFLLLFSSSNHPPFEFPDNMIELYDQPKATVHNAVKYADFALGEFLEKAKHSTYWENTLFLVVADHNSHVGGESLVPVPRFKIPALILGPGVTPRVYTELASQIDLPPTLLSLLGVSCETPTPGRDLTRKPDSMPGRAILQFYKNRAYMTGDHVVILQPGRPVESFKYGNLTLTPEPVDPSLAETALASALWPSWVYKKGLYTITP